METDTMKIEAMDGKQLRELIKSYDWDSEESYEAPARMIHNSECELALALDIFYRADGVRYFGLRARSKRGKESWMKFMDDLYEMILSGRIREGKMRYTVSLSKGKKFQLYKEDDVPEIFLEDVR